MIINNVQNKINFKDKKNHLKLSNSNSNLEIFKRNLMCTNNIMDEINMIKKKEKENSVEFLKIYKQTEAEYQESLVKIQKITQNMNESHYASIISINKIISTHRRVLELFSYLINGDLLFNWEKFRKEFNIFEAKFKMSQIQFEKINFKILSNILNKTTKDKIFSKEYLVKKEIGIYLIFKWIREVLKVYFYLEKQKNKSIEKNVAEGIKIPNRKNLKHKMIDIELDIYQDEARNFAHVYNSKNKENFLTRNISGNRIFYSDSEENFPNEKMIQVGGEIHPDDKLFHLTNMNPKISFESNFRINSNLKRSSFDKESPQIQMHMHMRITNSKKTVKNKINKTEIRLGFDVHKSKLSKDRTNLLSIPFIRYKNFHELKHYYKLESVNKNEEVDHKHFDDLNKLSLKRPTNRNKLLKLITSKRIDAVEERSVQNLILYDEIFARNKSTINMN